MSFKRKGQEEMVGFILIIILVVVLSLVFLGISLRRSTERTQSERVNNLLISTKDITTNCYKSFGLPYDIGGLIEACNMDGLCYNSTETSCQVLSSEVEAVLDAALTPNQEGKYKGYKADIFVVNGSEILTIEKGNKTRIMRSGVGYIPIRGGGGDIEFDLEVYI